MRVTPVIETKDRIAEGFMIADKVGEVRYVNLECLANKEKQARVDPEDLGTTMFGH